MIGYKAGQTVKTIYTNDDHTSVVYQCDVDNIYFWSKEARFSMPMGTRRWVSMITTTARTR